MSNRNSSNGSGQRSGRGRRRASETSDSEENQARKMRNRESAKRFRDKKIQATEELQKKNEELERRNGELLDTKNQLEKALQDHIVVLKRHLTSGCKLPDDILQIIESESGKVALDSRYTCDDVSLHDQDRGSRANPTGLFSGANLEKESESSPSRGKTDRKALNVENYQMKSIASRYGGVKVLQRTSPVQLVPNIDDKFNTIRFPNVVPKMTLPKEFLEASLKEPGYEETDTFENASTMNIERPSLTYVSSPSRQVNREFAPCHFSASGIQGDIFPNPSTSQSQQVRDTTITAELLSQALRHISPSEMSPSFQEQIKLCKTQSETLSPYEVTDQSHAQRSDLPINDNIEQFPPSFQPVVEPQRTRINQESQAITYAQAIALTNLKQQLRLQNMMTGQSDKVLGGQLQTTEKESCIADPQLRNDNMETMQSGLTSEHFPQQTVQPSPQLFPLPMTQVPIWMNEVGTHFPNGQYSIMYETAEEVIVQGDDQQFVPESQIPTTVISEAEKLEAEQSVAPNQEHTGSITMDHSGNIAEYSKF